MTDPTQTAPTTVPMQARRTDNYKAGRLREAVARKAYEVYTALWPGQTYDLLHERGGFGTGEVIAFLYARTFPRAEWRDRVNEAIEGTVL